MGICTPFVDNPLGRYQVVTSSTRPTNDDLYPGLWIYETDTERVLRYDGIDWIIMAEPAQTFVPVFANFTLGNGTVPSAYFHRSDGWCEFNLVVTLGTTSAVTGLIDIGLPKVAYGDTPTQVSLIAELRDTGVQNYPAVGQRGTTGFNLYAISAAGTYEAVVATSATVPFTWGANDQIVVSGRYRMEDLYG